MTKPAKAEPGPAMINRRTSALTRASIDRHLFLVDEARYAAFVAALDTPPRPTLRLRRLLAERPPWEK